MNFYQEFKKARLKNFNFKLKFKLDGVGQATQDT